MLLSILGAIANVGSLQERLKLEQENVFRKSQKV